MNQMAKAVDRHNAQRRREKEEASDRWHEGLENHEKLKKILPFLNEDEGYL